MRRPIQLEDDYIFNIADSMLFEQATSNFFDEFLKSYEQTVKEKFADLYDEFPEVFPFIEKARNSVVIFRNTEIQFNIYLGQTISVSHVHAQYKTFGDYKKIKDLSKEERNQKIQNLIGRTDEPLVSFAISYGFEGPTLDGSPGNASRDPEDLAEMGKIEGLQLAFEHVNKIKERFSMFEFERYVLRVDDEHFYYEVGEAIAAYKQGLYLAATAVAGVALENILTLIVNREIPRNKLNNAPYIRECLNELVNNNLMDDRRKREIMKFNDTRNGAAHSNSGKMLAKNAEEGFDIIKELIDEYYS